MALGSVLQHIFANAYFRFIGLTAEVAEDHTIGMIIFLCIRRLHLEWWQLTLEEPGLMKDASQKMIQHLRGSMEENLQKLKKITVKTNQTVLLFTCVWVLF